MSESKKKWESLFTEQEKSGLSIAMFCRARNINYGTFYTQRYRFRNNLSSWSKPEPKPKPELKQGPESKQELKQGPGPLFLVITNGDTLVEFYEKVEPEWFANFINLLDKG